MSAYLSPIGNENVVDANGNPLSGGKILSYVAGSSTPAATYTSSAGVTPQANPVILNTRGVPASPIWLQGGQAYKLVITDSNDVVLQTIDNVSGINDPAGVTAQDEWVIFTSAPTFLSATSFSVAGDQTLTFQVGRRVKSSNSGGTVYSTVFTSSFGAGITTVVLINDSGTLDSGLSSVSYGLLAASNTSAPSTIFAPMGECRLTKSGANLLLSPFNGNRLTINGAVYKVPPAGVTLAPPATTTTVYYIYAYMSAGVMTLEASTTTHATDTTTGMEVKSGDATRTLVGMARTLTNAWVDSATQRFVVSYFNRRRIRLMAATATISGINTTDVERTTSNRCEFLTWGDEAVRFGANGYVGNNAAGSINNSARGNIDGGTGTYMETVHYSAAINSVGAIGWSMTDALSEGYHYSSLNAFTDAGSGGVIKAQNWAEVMG